LLGLAFLMRYDLLVLLPAVAVAFLVQPRSSVWRSLMAVGGGFLLLVLPWVARNLYVTGDPIAMLSIERNLFGLAGTGTDVYSSLETPLFFDQLRDHAGMVLDKISFSGMAFPLQRPWLLAGRGLEWLAIVGFLSLAWLRRPAQRHLWIFLLVAYVLRTVLLGFMHQENRFYSAFVPLVLLLGIGGIWSLVIERAFWLRVLAAVLVLFGLGNAPRATIYGWSLQAKSESSQTEDPSRRRAIRDILDDLLPKHGLVAAPRAEEVAWNAQRPAINVRSGKRLVKLLESGADIEALYFPAGDTERLRRSGVERWFAPGPVLDNGRRVWTRPPAHVPEARLVVLYAPCTVNADRLAPYSDAVFYTPNLAAFAAESKTFERHQTEAGQSGIAYASLLSGTQADHHRVFAHPKSLPDELNLITEAFADEGWDVFAWANQGMASRKLGYWQGVPFRHYYSKPPLAGTDPRFAKILDRLAADPNYRAFVVASFTVSHWPYANRLDEFRARFPEEVDLLLQDLSEQEIAEAYQTYWVPGLRHDFPATRERIDLDDAALERLIQVLDAIYASNMANLDSLFGSVVAAIDERGLANKSIVAFTADHGEVLYRETALFKWAHGFQLAPEVLRVPLLIRAPGIEPGRVEAVTRSIDVAPTLAALAGVPMQVPPDQGRNLAASLLGQAPFPELFAYSHTSKVRDDKVRKAQANWKLFARHHPTSEVDQIWTSVRIGDRVFKRRHIGGGQWRHELFDHSVDPDEKNNLFDRTNTAHRSMVNYLGLYRDRLVRAATTEAGSGEAAVTNERQLKSLRALGYVE
jgi:arylsulfatase A-like enzyme